MSPTSTDNMKANLGEAGAYLKNAASDAGTTIKNVANAAGDELKLGKAAVKAGDRLEKDPDRRVQEAITLVFDKVAELGSARQANGDMIWRKPTYATIHRMIENPVYGGRLRLWQDPGRAEARRGHFAIRQPPQTAR